MRRLLLALFLTLCARGAAAEPLVADLTSHLIGISTGFTGTSVVLFGATDGGGDIVVVVRGPARELVVRRKSRVGPIWINTRQFTFEDVPGFYAVAASRPIDEISGPSVRALHQIGVENLRLAIRGPVREDRAKEFRDALIRTQQIEGMFPATVGKVDFLGDRLFRTTINFPATVPTGTYGVEVFLLRDKEVVAGQTTPLVVSKIGLDAQVSTIADTERLAYGIFAVLIAVMAGWVSSLPFRRA
jgi:uncharacterized protein (TIGR02186 family)